MAGKGKKVEIFEGMVRITGRRLSLGKHENFALENPVIVIKEADNKLISAILTLATLTAHSYRDKKRVMAVFDDFKKKLEKGK